MHIYQNLPQKRRSNQPKHRVQIRVQYVFGVIITVTGSPDTRLEARALDRITGQEITRLELGVGTVKIPIEYLVPWEIRFFQGEKQIQIETWNPKGKRVLIAMGSDALGDTIAWATIADVFQQRECCEVFISTYHNHIIDTDKYPSLTFVEPGDAIQDLYAAYRIGWRYDRQHVNNLDTYMMRTDVRKLPLHQTASTALGMRQVLGSKLHLRRADAPVTELYACIAPMSTCQAKFWNHPQGWQTVVDFLIARGFKVYIASSEKDGHQGNHYPQGAVCLPDHEIETTMAYIEHADLFLGLSSGLSWLSWALGAPTILISGATDPYTEPQFGNIHRIAAPEGVCSGCCNRHRIARDKHGDMDWQWCPDQKGAKKFECTKTITPEHVIDVIAKVLTKSHSAMQFA